MIQFTVMLCQATSQSLRLAACAKSGKSQRCAGGFCEEIFIHYIIKQMLPMDYVNKTVWT